MRRGLIVLAIVVVVASPARAQYVNPFSGSWFLSSPVDPWTGGKPDDEQNCVAAPSGRNGLRYRCPPPTPTATVRR
jgi:hypothetical protein